MLIKELFFKKLMCKKLRCKILGFKKLGVEVVPEQFLSTVGPMHDLWATPSEVGASEGGSWKVGT